MLRQSTGPRVIADAGALRALVAKARRDGQSIGLVPTMGALHAGHLSLVDAARRECGFTAVSIFVNPTQFGPREDFARYPRTLEADLQSLAGRGVDAVFTPSTEAMYRADHATFVEMAGPALPLEGEFRPGHFRGVATIVLKLFHMVAPDRAYFGHKDYQQSLIVRQLVKDFNLPIEIVVCPTVREPDGLALSSRNVFLSADERRRALAISQSLQLVRQLITDGTRDAGTLLARVHERLSAAELQVDYVALADPETLLPVETVVRPALLAIAARVGNTRLIDNDIVGGPPATT
ncbi:MAG: pantoate--beta-alanine ligase [Pirellulales bacterium]